jgi:hypothetical protein
MPAPVKAADDDHFINDLEPERVGELIEVATSVFPAHPRVSNRVYPDPFQTFLNAIKEFLTEAFSPRLIPFGCA